MTYGVALNIIGGEWVIIIFVALVLILGTNKLPEAAKKMGKVVNEYNRAKEEIKNNLSEAGIQQAGVKGPVESERKKLELMCTSLGIDFIDKSDALREAVQSKMGQMVNPATKNPTNLAMFRTLSAPELTLEIIASQKRTHVLCQFRFYIP